MKTANKTARDVMLARIALVGGELDLVGFDTNAVRSFYAQLRDYGVMGMKRTRYEVARLAEQGFRENAKTAEAIKAGG